MKTFLFSFPGCSRFFFFVEYHSIFLLCCGVFYYSTCSSSIYHMLSICSITVNKEQPFKDKCFLYRFRVDEEGTAGGLPSADDINAANEHIRENLSNLYQRGPDATLRMILRKP